MKLKNRFPPVVDVSEALRARIRAKFGQIKFPAS